ncbi:hypothetical protein [Mycobacterium sp. DL592]|uniref:hypothetical protein n=1 Tax=Mycobacterium sp. DL592 TaxID=2675524 RepID=UPI001FBAF36E|nr:hypothetical protein [Mycobacterium sp. DL592]
MSSMPEFHEFHPIGGGIGGAIRMAVVVVVGAHAARTAADAALTMSSRRRNFDLLYSMTGSLVTVPAMPPTARPFPTALSEKVSAE